MCITRFCRLLAQACVIATGFTGITAGADPLTLDEALARAVERDESLLRADALADARAERAVADGALPDPEIFIGFQNLPAGDISTTADPMTMTKVGIRQMFPPGRSRQLLQGRGELEAQALHAERAARVHEIRREVRRAWLDWRLAWRSLEESRALEAEFARLVELIERRLATGSARQRDLYQARLEHAALKERVIEFKSRTHAAAAELERWLDAPVGPERTPAEAPDWPVLEIDRLRGALREHPALRAPEMRTRAARAGVEIARQRYRPAWMAEVSYGARAGGRSDLVSGMVSISVPLFTRDRQDRRLAAAVREQEAARAGHADRLRHLQGELERQWSLWSTLDELVAFYDAQLLPEAEQTRESTLTAYRNDRASVDELVRAQVGVIDYRLRALRAARQRDAARTELLYLAGE